MPMDAVVLGGLIKANVHGLSDDGAKNPDLLFQALAAAIIQHLQTAGVVTVVTACGAGAGTGTGTVA